MNRRRFLIHGIAAGVGTLGVSKLAGDTYWKKDNEGSTPVECAVPVGPSTTRQMLMHSQQQLEADKNGRFTLKIAPVVVGLTRKYAISTVGYNGTSPGPILRMREGVPVTVDVSNETDVPEMVHWHGLIVPPEVDGAEDEGTPFIAPHTTRRYTFTPGPAGTRWYHTQVSAGIDLYRGLYTGQFGFVYVEPRDEPGRYDQEFFLALREWEPFYTREPKARQKALARLKVDYWICSINDKALGSGDPIRVRRGQRVLFHMLNASATELHRVALPGHRFLVVALDGNAVPKPRPVDVLQIGPGERVDAVVEMNQPGIWILGSTKDDARNSGMGIVIEYSGKAGFPRWLAPPSSRWDYTRFGRMVSHSAPEETINLVVEATPGELTGPDNWQANSKEYPHDIMLREGARYRVVLHNRNSSPQSVHLHRHLFEIVDVNGKSTAGIMKDTIVAPAHGRISLDLVAGQPGLALFHCQVQQQMDYAFKTLFRCV